MHPPRLLERTPNDALPLAALAAYGDDHGLLLRLQIRRPGALAWSLRVGVADRAPEAPEGGDGSQPLRLLGELKGWAVPTSAGLRLDTMRVAAGAPPAVGPLIWAATFAWALEATPCRRARLLAIHDDDQRHMRLVRYFRALGFGPLRPLGGGLADLGPRLLWGGAGLLMEGSCRDGLERSLRRLERLEPAHADDPRAA